ncbi:hypothetical protein [Desulforhopalus sp. IMCC35007]|uniref:hypothetical protein n=1 Tax=Desulforhopalus sp. IMCC35007 TaxID=2569543 RepID=UPI0010AE57AD|nr:hypothetical protein [Desulforhopalus sp. IMCC35007]TKB05804.1 hypothetical protein FCL48_23375 [Desulforhopalus sp. IMCC35007]
MAFWPSGIATPHELRTRDHYNRDLVFLSGYPVFDFRGSGGSWKHDELYVVAGPAWRNLIDVTPVVSLASISNSNHAVNAGWAVDGVRWETYNSQILLRIPLAIRDSDGYIHRVAYQITAVGNIL